MKLYDFGPAANAKRVHMFLAEKGIEVPIAEVQVRDGTLFKEPYRTMNPFAVVPFLELEDGTIIGDPWRSANVLRSCTPSLHCLAVMLASERSSRCGTAGSKSMA